ncbi:MAG: MOSC domain-containing protein [Pseudomonadota bacterium]
MKSIAELTAQHALTGRLDWIGLRPARRAPLEAVTNAEMTENGLQGDRARAGKRAVTLIQAEHLPVIAALTGQDAPPELLRRNLVVAHLNLAALRGRHLRIGATAILRITSVCAPCSRMEETFGRGGYNAVRGHGGWCAEVTQPGTISLGDEVRALP